MRILLISLWSLWIAINCDVENVSLLRKRLTNSEQKSRSGFVYAPGDGNLYLRGKLFNFRNFNAPTLFEGGDYQGRDILKSLAGFGTPVTRTYTLKIANEGLEFGRLSPEDAHVIGWDKSSNEWRYNENQWQIMDQMMELSRHYGVKVIIPIINQDYRNPDSNYIGNFNDLIRHRYNIYEYKAASDKIDFFTDRTMIDAYKQLITFFLNRINTVNGIRYGNDNTILAFETGNEMNWGARRPATPPPAQWTIEIAQHLKHLAPNILVMDGSYSRNASVAWEDEALKSAYVDLFSYHFYGGGDTESYEMLDNKIRSQGKTLIIGEHGFYSDVHVWRRLYAKMTCAGALVWSLFPHSEKGGFLTHGEGHNVHSYHVPGWRNQTSDEFDVQEAEAIDSTYEASYTILGVKPPPKPIPGRPDPFIVQNNTHIGLSWRGAAWAAGYEIFGARNPERQFALISDVIADNVVEGGLFIPLDPGNPTGLLKIKHRKTKLRHSHDYWTDTKWCGGPRMLPCQRTSFRNNRYGIRKGDIFEDSTKNPSMKVMPPMESMRGRERRKGGWYSVRGVSEDGTYGKLSKPVFLPTDYESDIHN